MFVFVLSKYVIIYEPLTNLIDEMFGSAVEQLSTKISSIKMEGLTESTTFMIGLI